MVNQQINIKELSIIELKALCFDLQNILGQNQRNLKILADELELRSKVMQAQTVVPPIPQEDKFVTDYSIISP